MIAHGKSSWSGLKEVCRPDTTVVVGGRGDGVASGAPVERFAGGEVTFDVSMSFSRNAELVLHRRLLGRVLHSGT
ncbi:MAG TPA: hypothetical protein VMM60_17975 [Ilumatobacter sp.]|nr:hypothetical protein [Ilumatobacter sp.]